jgi:hypothetical protein
MAYTLVFSSVSGRITGLYVTLLLQGRTRRTVKRKASDTGGRKRFLPEFYLARFQMARQKQG